MGNKAENPIVSKGKRDKTRRNGHAFKYDVNRKGDFETLEELEEYKQFGGYLPDNTHDLQEYAEGRGITLTDSAPNKEAVSIIEVAS